MLHRDRHQIELDQWLLKTKTKILLCVHKDIKSAEFKVCDFSSLFGIDYEFTKLFMDMTDTSFWGPKMNVDVRR